MTIEGRFIENSTVIICDHCNLHKELAKTWKDKPIGTSETGGWYTLREVPKTTSLTDLKEGIEKHFCSLDCLSSFVKFIKEEDELLRNKVYCMGDGSRDAGCGYMGGKSGETCPECNGMLLDEESIIEAEETVEEWEKRVKTKKWKG